MYRVAGLRQGGNRGLRFPRWQILIPKVMQLIFLGTASGTPSIERNVSALALRFDDGRCWIFDCGEGTQQRLLQTSIRPGRIERIFISHVHGDHCYGLPGLLASINVHDRGSAPVEVIAPSAIAGWWRCTQRATCQGLSFPVRFASVEGLDDLGSRDGLRIKVVALRHRVPSFGYVLTEPPRRGRFDPVRARALGVPSGPLFGRLAAGETVTLDDGRQVASAAVLGPTRPGRRVAILGDTDDPSTALEVVRGCDVLVHECTYDATRTSKARRWRHSTTAMVAAFAAAAEVRHVILTHFSSRYFAEDAPLGVADLVDEVADGCPQAQVYAAYDGWTFDVPDPY